jgi:zinc protease
MAAEHRPLLRTLPRPIPGTPPKPRVPTGTRWALSTGVQVLSVQRSALPQLALKLIVPTGSVADPAEQRGLAALTGSLLLEGTASTSAEALNARLDALGASLSVHTGHDFLQVELLLLSETMEAGIEILGDVVSRPAFPERELERHRAEMLDALEARLDEPANIADDVASVELFGEQHPYGYLSTGTPEGLAGIDRDDVLDFYARYIRPGGAVLILAGAFDETALRLCLERSLAEWQGITATPVRSPLRGPAAAKRTAVPWDGASQAEIRVASLGLARSSPDWIAASVANYLLGGSTITGRLGLNLREDKGWTYGVRSAFSAGVQPAGWTIDTAVEREVADDALGEILDEIRRLAQHGVSAEELSRAKEAMILSLPRAFETPAKIVSRLATQEAFGLGERYWQEFAARVESVTEEDVLRIAREHFDTDTLVQVLVT